MRSRMRQFVALALLLAAALAIEGLRLLGLASGGVAELATRLLFLLAALLLAHAAAPISQGPRRWQLGRPLIGLVGFVAALLVYVASGATLAAWAALALWFALLIWLAIIWGGGRWNWPVVPLLAMLAGVVPMLFEQIATQFSEEEFFSALEALALAGLWLALWLAFHLNRISPLQSDGRAWLVPRWTMLLLALPIALGGNNALQAYQRSFFSTDAPLYPGISAAQPFICGTAPTSEASYDGRAVYDGMLAELAARPDRSILAHGMLALGTSEQRWANAFRTQLLKEAQDGAFTQPANSVKYIQYEASQRLYFYAAIRARFPDLFSPADQAIVRDWFATINRRALTVGWVDGAYALALGAWPEGPYENQESGAGLLALLESNGLADPASVTQNRDYLARNPRGWLERFRNTDDAVIYQPEWINNALFQRTLVGTAPAATMHQSFEWLLLQALPDGAPLRYNHPYAANLTSVAYLGATLTGDPRLLWLAGRSLEKTEQLGKPVIAQPGLAGPLDQTGMQPEQGSCLLYGDSGMPNQRGPLAPDKIVLRDGWARDSLYAMLNLRFSGWHRYKATNALTLVYQGQPLLAEQLEGASFAWLPRGRSFFRDKRVPRENLNGLVIEKSGLSAALYTLTGLGGPWAQDPPHYASVASFATSAERDTSSTVINDWHGWRHQRDLTLVHSGLLVVEDRAVGPAGRRAAITWQPSGESTQADRIALPGGAELVVKTLDGGVTVQDAGRLLAETNGGLLHVVSVVLTQHWRGATLAIASGANGLELRVQSGQHSAIVPLGE